MDQQPPQVPSEQYQPTSPASASAPAPMNTSPAAPTSDPGQGLAIASLVTALFGISLAGLILGIMARSKSKAVGKSNGLALAGIIISAIGLVLTALWILFIIVAAIGGTKASNDLKKSYDSANKQSMMDNVEGEGGKTVSKTGTTGACLTYDDFPISDSSKYFYQDNVFFKADSTDYQYDVKPAEIAINTYNKFKDRTFTVYVEGMVNSAGNTAAGEDLADSRAQKVYDVLIAGGIPASVIKLKSSKDSTGDAMLSNASENRTVTITYSLGCE